MSMYKGLTYGPVLITKGLHKGKIGYFDDTDTDNKLIIYPNMPTHCNDYYKVNISEATSVLIVHTGAEISLKSVPHGAGVPLWVSSAWIPSFGALYKGLVLFATLVGGCGC